MQVYKHIRDEEAGHCTLTPGKILTCIAQSGMGETWGLGTGILSLSDQSGFFTVLWGSLKNERFQSSDHEAESRDGQVHGPPHGKQFCCPVQMFSVDVEVTVQFSPFQKGKHYTSRPGQACSLAPRGGLG